MRVDDMIIISIDDHIVEPPDMFDAHLPDKYRDQAPKLVRDSQGFDQWIYEDTAMGMVGLNATVSWPKEEWGFNPSSLAEMRPGSYLVRERVRDMDRNGVLASMCFPSFVGLSCSRPTTTGTSTNGVVRIPAGSSRWRFFRCGTSMPLYPNSVG
jgi:hypothetical protein